MTDEAGDWSTVRGILWEALPKIDEVLNDVNIPISDRKTKAFDLIRETMLEVSDWEAFFVSPAHGQFHVLISEWYQERYGDAVSEDHSDFLCHAVIHGTPFPMVVPHLFRLPDKDPGLQWIGFPASVQPEENCLDWIQGGPKLSSLSSEDHALLSSKTQERADQIRSTAFDLRALMNVEDAKIIRLAASVRSNLESASRYLCKRSDADLRHAASEVSQAVEKAFKLFLRRKGIEPPRTHDLRKLADLAEENGLPHIGNASLASIPSGSDAASIRYEGVMELKDVIEAYDAGLAVISQTVEACTPDHKFNIRQARFQIKKPPWFEFDRDEFLSSLKGEDRSNPKA